MSHSRSAAAFEACAHQAAAHVSQSPALVPGSGFNLVKGAPGTSEHQISVCLVEFADASRKGVRKTLASDSGPDFASSSPPAGRLSAACKNPLSIACDHGRGNTVTRARKTRKLQLLRWPDHAKRLSAPPRKSRKTRPSSLYLSDRIVCWGCRTASRLARAVDGVHQSAADRRAAPSPWLLECGG